MRFAPVAFILAIAAGCATPPKGGADALTVIDYDGAAGYGRRVEYDGRAVSIVATSDFEGEKDKTIWTRRLSTAERAFLDERIDDVPLASLKDEYRDPSVWDGLQLHFKVRQRGKASRSIDVANTYVEELAVICDGLNAMLPQKHRIRYREWKEWNDEMDREAAEQPG